MRLIGLKGILSDTIAPDANRTNEEVFGRWGRVLFGGLAAGVRGSYGGTECEWDCGAWCVIPK